MSDQNNKLCKCTYPCNRHGDCEACQAYHIKCGSKTHCGVSAKTKKPKEGK